MYFNVKAAQQLLTCDSVNLWMSETMDRLLAHRALGTGRESSTKPLHTVKPPNWVSFWLFWVHICGNFVVVLYFRLCFTLVILHVYLVIFWLLILCLCKVVVCQFLVILCLFQFYYIYFWQYCVCVFGHLVSLFANNVSGFSSSVCFWSMCVCFLSFTLSFRSFCVCF